MNDTETKDGPVSVRKQDIKELKKFWGLSKEEQIKDIESLLPNWKVMLGKETRELTHEELLNREYYRGRFASRFAGARSAAEMIFNWEETPLKMKLENLVAIAKPDDTLASIVQNIISGDKQCFGIALIVDDEMRLIGIINYGDILRFLADELSLNKVASDIMIKNPITAIHGSNESDILKSVKSQVLKKTRGKKEVTQFVPLIDEDGVVKDIVDIFELLSRQPSQYERVVVYGLGFVGLTLAVSLASRGHTVKGIDNNEAIVDELKTGRPHIRTRLNGHDGKCIK